MCVREWATAPGYTRGGAGGSLAATRHVRELGLEQHRGLRGALGRGGLLLLLEQGEHDAAHAHPIVQ